MTKSALIGATGFVGGNLLRQRDFESCFNSRNIDEIRGQSFDLVVCAGARAEKWIANSDPEADRANIDRLLDALMSIRAAQVVLISTVDVYPSPVEVDEDAPIDASAATPYGRHRRMLETALEGRFKTTVVRLPGLFGAGLKKNVIYDFLNDNNLERIDARGVFQFYDVGRLWCDVERCLRQGISLLNVATEPVSVGEVAASAFGREFRNELPGRPARYDFRSKHAGVWGGRSGYLYDKATVLRDMIGFVTSATAARAGGRS